MIKKIALMLLIVGCASNETRESSLKESRKEITNAATKTNITSHTGKPLINATGAKNTTINVTLEELPMEDIKATQEKTASEETWATQSISTLWKKFSSWVYIGLAFSFLMVVLGIRQLEKTKTFKIAQSSISGGLRVFNALTKEVDTELQYTSPDSTSFKSFEKVKRILSEKTI